MLQQRLNCFDKRKIVRRVAHNEDDDDDEDAVHERDDFDVDDDRFFDFSFDFSHALECHPFPGIEGAF